MGWFFESKEEREFREKLDEVKGEIAETKSQIDKLGRGGYSGMTNDEISREINGRRRR